MTQLRVLFVSSEWPTSDTPLSGVQIYEQMTLLRAEGVQVDIFHFRGRQNPLIYLKAITDFREECRNKVYDVIHAHHGQAGVVALSQRRVPVVVTFRGSDLFGIYGRHGYQLSGRVLQVVSQCVARGADEVIVVSELLAPKLKNRKVHVIPSGVNRDLFKPMNQAEARRALNLPPDCKLVLFAGGQNNPVKRFSLAQEAIRLVSSEFSPQMVVTEGIPHEKMVHYMNACDLLLLTSQHEGSPNVVKEALSCNLPVVSVHVGDVHKQIGHIEGCVLCADDHPLTIAAAIEKTIRRGRRIDGDVSASEYDQHKLIDKLIVVYENALGTRRS